MLNQEIQQHSFTNKIIEILKKHFNDKHKEIFESSHLLGYLNKKTKSANRGSKSRGSFANHYALYVLLEDYISKGFADGTSEIEYKKYEGARFTDLLKRQRELPFGAKLQNHALNSRLNDEFKKYYPSLGKQPVIRDLETQRYWIQEDLLLITIRDHQGYDHDFNIAPAILDIIDSYVATKLEAFETFLSTCKDISEISSDDPQKSIKFISDQLQPNVDARIFEIVSYAILKSKYSQQKIWIGNEKETVEQKILNLYKTGRTNANDGGIDFVMKPIGRFFQVTETIDASKYFLDIDKVQRFPITFVVKSDDEPLKILDKVKKSAISKYKIEQVVQSYLNSIEEIINIEQLINDFSEIVNTGKLQEVMDEIIIQSHIEFNYDDNNS